MNTESLAISSLKLDPANARRHDAKNLAAIKGSLKAFGQQKPIVVSADGTVIAGNGTLEAAKALGWDKIDVVRSGLEGNDRTAFALADNRSAELAAWDDATLVDTLRALQEDKFDIDSIGFDGFDLSLPPAEGNTDPDEVPENVETRCKPGDLWTLGKHRLLCGDSTDVLHVERLLAGNTPLLMVTDPPYGVEYDPNWRTEAAARPGAAIHGGAGPGKGIVANDDRFDWTTSYVLYGAQVAYVWHGGRRAKEVQQSLEDADFVVVSQIIWSKPTFAISRGDYHWQHEPCWYAHRKGATHNWQGSRSESTLWEIKRGHGNANKTGHGTEKPVECMERPVRNNSKTGDLVCDPFLGSGSTLIACEKTGRRCFGMEIDPKYCDVILARWEAFTGLQASLVTEV